MPHDAGCHASSKCSPLFCGRSATLPCQAGFPSMANPAGGMLASAECSMSEIPWAATMGYPQVAEYCSFIALARLPWRNTQRELFRWCEGPLQERARVREIGSDGLHSVNLCSQRPETHSKPASHSALSAFGPHSGFTAQLPASQNCPFPHSSLPRHCGPHSLLRHF